MSSSASPIIRSIESRSYYRGASTCTPISRPHIEEFLESGGKIEIGRVSPIGDVAVASDENTMLAALTRNADETLMELIQRLEAAVDLAVNHDTFTDEINGP
jgi:hypothetical protein